MISIATVKRIITPLEPAPFCGYSRKELSKGALDDIESNVLLIKLKEKELVIITLDFLFINDDFTEKIKEKIYQEFNIPLENVIVSTIHTHSGPSVFKLPSSNRVIGDSYIEFVLKEIIDSLRISKTKLEPVKVVMKKDKLNGFYGNRNEIDGIYDDEVIVINFINQLGKSVANLVNISCHPTILKADNLYFSSDLLGRIRLKLSELWESPVIITNGACGDTSCRFFTKNSKYDEVVNRGDAIAEIINNFTNGIDLKFDECSIESITMPIEYTKEDIFVKEFFNKIHSNSTKNAIKGIPNEISKSIIENKFKDGNYNYMLKSWIYTFKDFRIVTIPGELVSTLGIKIKEMSNIKNTIIICYANGYVSYLIDENNYGKYFEVLHTRMGKEKAEEFINKILLKIK